MKRGRSLQKYGSNLRAGDFSKVHLLVSQVRASPDLEQRGIPQCISPRPTGVAGRVKSGRPSVYSTSPQVWDGVVGTDARPQCERSCCVTTIISLVEFPTLNRVLRKRRITAATFKNVLLERADHRSGLGTGSPCTPYR